MRRQLKLLASILMFCGIGVVQAYGPFDYSNPDHRKTKLPIVEQYHFNADVENLIKGMTGTIWGDLNYTLKTFPNHHRALFAMAKYARRNNMRMPGAPPGTSAENYFQSAMTFAPNDPTVYLIYGIHLHKLKKLKDAKFYYDKALSLAPDAEAHYNLGLLYLDLDQLENAKRHAIKAYEMNHPLPGLRNRLKRAGVWGNSKSSKNSTQ